MDQFGTEQACERCVLSEVCLSQVRAIRSTTAAASACAADNREGWGQQEEMVDLAFHAVYRPGVWFSSTVGAAFAVLAVAQIQPSTPIIASLPTTSFFPSIAPHPIVSTTCQPCQCLALVAPAWAVLAGQSQALADSFASLKRLCNTKGEASELEMCVALGTECLLV